MTASKWFAGVLAVLAVHCLAGCTKPSGEAGGTGQAPAGAPVLPTASSDSKLEASVKAKLAAEPALKGETIEVKVKDGRATLSGAVSTSAAKQKAEDVVRAMDDVYGVDVQALTAKN